MQKEFHGSNRGGPKENDVRIEEEFSMKHIIVGALLFMLALPSSVIKAESLPDGADLFIEAVRYRWDNHTLVHSLSYVAEQIYRIPTLSAAEIEKKADVLEREISEALKNNPNAHMWLDGTREAVREHYSKGSIPSRYTVMYKAPSFSRKLLSLQIEREGHGQKKWELETSVIEANVVGEKSTSEGALLFAQNRTADVNDVGSYMEALLNFGRLKGQSASSMLTMLFQDADVEKYEFSEKNIAKFKAERERLVQAGRATMLMTVGTTTYDGVATAFIVESYMGGKITERYWIDVARGYVCPLVQYYDTNGNLLAEYKSEDFFLHEKSGLWFPQLHKEMTTGQDGKQESKEYRIEKSSVDVNFPITDDGFLLEIPDGTKVVDSRKGKGSRQYIAIDNGMLSLGKGGLDLEKMKWLAPTEISFASKERFFFVRVFFVAVGIVMILWGLYLRFSRKS